MDKIKLVISGFFAFTFIMALIGLIVGFPIKWLWNWLMPELFPSANIAQISFWHALGLWILGGFLFKGGNNPQKSS